MDWKDFAKPNARNILLTLILLLSSLFYKRPNYCFDANCYPRGFPLPFVDEMAGGLRIAHQKYIGYFIMFFLITCSIIYILNRLKK